MVLDNDKVDAARQDALGWIKRAEVHVKRPITECLEVTGKQPISLKWLDSNKGHSEKPNYQSRLVVRDVKTRHGSLRTHVVLQHATLGSGQALLFPSSKQEGHLWKGAKDSARNTS